MSEPELKELKHEAWPGYRTAFKVVFGLFILYFIIIVAMAPDGGFISHHH